MIWSVRGSVIGGLVTVALLFVGIGVWGSTAELSGAVIASGEIATQLHDQVVQHPDGGIVQLILVKEGDRVEKGDPLILLDGSELSSRRASLARQIDAGTARRARLKAELAGSSDVAFPAQLIDRSRTVPETADALDGERALFDARFALGRQATQAFEEQAKQIADAIDGQRAEAEAADAQLVLLRGEVEAAQLLADRGLMESGRLSALLREQARLQGAAKTARASIEADRARLAEIAINIARLTESRREEAAEQLQDLTGKVAEIRDALHLVDIRLSRLTLTAPSEGIVHDLRIQALGSVLRAADLAMTIVPLESGLTVFARIDPSHVDSVAPGQGATLKFTAFDARATPEIAATVARVTPEVSTDARTGAKFYTAELRVEPKEIVRLGRRKLLPGMPVEVFIQTGTRSPLSLIARPFVDYFAMALQD